MIVTEVERLYRPFWKGTNTPNGVSNAAVILAVHLSAKSVSGWEGYDFITLTPIISDALAAAEKRGFQAGADAARRECAEMVDAYDIDADDPDRKFHTPARIANQILARVGQPVKE